MTIAAGLVATDGILLCADTLYTDGQTKDYRDKIFSWTGKGAAACFAIAGNATIARMVVDECCDALSGYRGRTLSISNILTIARPIVKNAYEQYVDTRPSDERQAADFWLLIAASAATQGFRLYSSMRSAIARVDTFECIGVGRQVGRYIIEPSYRGDMTVDGAAVLAIHALAAAKERVDGVDGKSQFLAVKDGFVSPVVPQNVDSWEMYVLQFRTAASRLLLTLGDGSVDEQAFNEGLEEFCKEARSIRAFWRGDPWQYMVDKFHAFIKKKAETEPAGQPDSQSTKADLSHLLPSPGSRGASGEP